MKFRKREASEKKEAKLEKLRRLAEGENVGKHDFHDPGYDRERDEATGRPPLPELPPPPPPPAWQKKAVT